MPATGDVVVPSMCHRSETGSSFGARHERVDVAMPIDLFMDGEYQVRERISQWMPLGETNHAFDFDHLQQGEVKRSVVYD